MNLGVSNVHSGEADMRILPKYPGAAGSQVGILFCHSAGSTAIEPTTPNWAAFILPLATAGHPILATDLGGTTTWGNDTVVSRITEAKAYLHSAMGAKTGKIVLVGMSMGGLAAMVWAAQNPTLVAAFVGVAAVCDVTDIVTNNRAGTAASVNSAYSGGWSQATYGAVHNPTTLAAAGSLAAIPALIFTGTEDPLVIPATVDTLVSHMPLGTRVPVVGQHTIPVPVDPIVEFVAAHV